MEIRDNYTHLPFRELKDVSELKEGMMVQVVESNIACLKWEWAKVDSRYIEAVSKDASKLKHVRIPAY